MDLIPRLLLALARLAALDRPARLAVEPLPALLGSLAGPAVAAEAAVAFPSGEQPVAIARLTRALAMAMRDPTTHRRLADLAAAAEALLVASGAVAAPGLGAVQLRLGGQSLAQLIRLLRLSPPATAPQILLVGALAVSGSPLELSLDLAPPLDGLAIGYAAGIATPRWRSELWLRIPPDPNMRRLAEWPPDLLFAARRIELYRQRLPGPDPEAVILTEPVTLPSRLGAGHVSVELHDQGEPLAALRSTVLDKFQHPLVIVERMMPLASRGGAHA